MRDAFKFGVESLANAVRGVLSQLDVIIYFYLFATYSPIMVYLMLQRTYSKKYPYDA